MLEGEITTDSNSDPPNSNPDDPDPSTATATADDDDDEEKAKANSDAPCSSRDSRVGRTSSKTSRLLVGYSRVK